MVFAEESRGSAVGTGAEPAAAAAVSPPRGARAAAAGRGTCLTWVRFSEEVRYVIGEGLPSVLEEPGSTAGPLGTLFTLQYPSCRPSESV